MIEIYTKRYCDYCSKAKELLNSFYIPYKEYVIGEDISRDWVLENFPHVKTVPIILKDKVIIGGYTDLILEFSRNNNFGKELLVE